MCTWAIKFLQCNCYMRPFFGPLPEKDLMPGVRSSTPATGGMKPKTSKRLYIAQPAGMLCNRAEQWKKRLVLSVTETPSDGGYTRIQGREERTEINCINAVAHAAKKSKRQTCLKCCYSHTHSVSGRAGQDEAPRKSPGPQNWHKDLPSPFETLFVGLASWFFTYFPFVLGFPPFHFSAPLSAPIFWRVLFTLLTFSWWQTGEMPVC